MHKTAGGRINSVAAVLAAILGCAWLGLSSPGVAQERPFDPLEFLVGSCWKGDFPDGRGTDEHCYEWVYEGKFIRDRHIVLRQGEAAYRAETWYAWDQSRKQLVYHYYNSHGNVSRGTVVVATGQLVFPESVATAEGVRVLRTLLRRTDADRYEIRTEEEKGGTWHLLWSMVLVRQPRWNEHVAPRTGSSARDGSSADGLSRVTRFNPPFGQAAVAGASERPTRSAGCAS